MPSLRSLLPSGRSEGIRYDRERLRGVSGGRGRGDSHAGMCALDLIDELLDEAEVMSPVERTDHHPPDRSAAARKRRLVGGGQSGTV
ncbi:MAG: hypothetical protein IT307_17885 [Chloroflexi bacterium]|nr:hypothetical protein [Chloroflexota bacterium]